MQKEQYRDSFRRFLLADKIMRHEDNTTLEHLMVKKSSISSQTLLAEGRVIDELPFAKMVYFEKELYFIHIPPPPPPPQKHEFADTQVLQNTKKSDMLFVGVVMFMIDMLILFFFVYLIKKINSSL